MPQELPGFYYDAEKNRYFPVKGPIPGSSPIASSSSASGVHKSVTESKQAEVRKRLGRKTAEMLQIRELYGTVITSAKGKYNFKEQYMKRLVSEPLVWRYSGTNGIADCALEKLYVDADMPDGAIRTKVLLAAGLNSSLCVYVVDNSTQQYQYGVRSRPDSAWPVNIKGQEGFAKSPECLMRLDAASVTTSSTISCIKKFGKYADGTSPMRNILNRIWDLYAHACRGVWAVTGLSFPSIECGRILVVAERDDTIFLITTLGSETSGGSVSILNLNDPLPLNLRDPIIRRRMHNIATIKCTIWSADVNSDFSQAVIGTNVGAALVNVETGTPTWVCRCKSDIFSVQLDHSEKFALCGLRNGTIVTVDVRQRSDSYARLTRQRILMPSRKTGEASIRSSRNSTKNWFELRGSIYQSGTISMPSSISCLASLKLYDQYFLASSMDGLIKLYDHRMVHRGAVQSYEGNVNSHTRIQLGVDPSEKFVMSGGEDNKLRLWSIKSGELLFEERFMSSIPSVVCWQRNDGIGHIDYEQSHSGEAWLGSRSGLFHMQWS